MTILGERKSQSFVTKVLCPLTLQGIVCVAVGWVVDLAAVTFIGGIAHIATLTGVGGIGLIGRI